eukprot:TRINITY_DN939_c0_g4_i4.p1 TRINITY_DN939_c0_g4~~TRINITY_DN939_c0_g4_i4.p1  ORF type:complete len:1248 (+),score=348.87 TRINITY_DN939_c0_g4_i4:2480-6223(+)
MHAVLDDGLAGLGQGAVAALVDRHVQDHRAGLHGLDGVFADQDRCLAARDQGGGDDDVGLFGALVYQLGLALHPVRRHRTGIAAHALGDLFFLIRQEGHVEEFRAQRFDLLLDRRTHVRRLDHRAQALGRGDGLQAGHTGAHDQHARGLDGAGGGHQHGHEALVGVGGHQHGLVAGDVGLRRQHIHRLRAGGAGRGFEGEGGEAGGGHGGDVVGVEGVEHADDDGAGLDAGALGLVGGAYLEDDVGAADRLDAVDAGAHGEVGLVRDAGAEARAGLHPHFMAGGYQFFHRLRGRGHARFALPGFDGNAYDHCLLLLLSFLVCACDPARWGTRSTAALQGPHVLHQNWWRIPVVTPRRLPNSVPEEEPRVFQASVSLVQSTVRQTSVRLLKAYRAVGAMVRRFPLVPACLRRSKQTAFHRLHGPLMFHLKPAEQELFWQSAISSLLLMQPRYHLTGPTVQVPPSDQAVCLLLALMAELKQVVELLSTCQAPPTCNGPSSQARLTALDSPLWMSPATSPALQPTVAVTPLQVPAQRTLLSRRAPMVQLPPWKPMVWVTLESAQMSQLTTMSWITAYWRPSVTLPKPPCRPTSDSRPNRRVPLVGCCCSAPVSVPKPVSSENSAASPPPRSSVPLKPMRLPDSGPPASCTLLPPAAFSLVLQRIDESTIPQIVTLLCACAPQLTAPRTAADMAIFFIDDSLQWLIGTTPSTSDSSGAGVAPPPGNGRQDVSLNGPCSLDQRSAATAPAMRRQPSSMVSTEVAMDMRMQGERPQAVPATSATPVLSRKYMTTSISLSSTRPSGVVRPSRPLQLMNRQKAPSGVRQLRPGMALMSARPRSRRRRQTSANSATKDWSPVSAASAAAWLTELGLLVDCDCRMSSAPTRSAGPAAQPMRQPVMAQVLETPLTSRVRSRNAGAALSRCGVGWSPKRMCSQMSSVITSTWRWRSSTAASARSSSMVQVAPVGLLGELRISHLVRGVMARSSVVGVSLKPSASTQGTITGVPSQASTMSGQETQQGAGTSTSSPLCTVMARALKMACLAPQVAMISLGAQSRPFSRLNLAAMAWRSAGVPAVAVQRVWPASMAAAAAWRMWAGVSKSGSPTTRLTMSLPWRRNSAARSAAALLGDCLMRRTRSAIREEVTLALQKRIRALTVSVRVLFRQDDFRLAKQPRLMDGLVAPLAAPARTRAGQWRRVNRFRRAVCGSHNGAHHTKFICRDSVIIGPAIKANNKNRGREMEGDNGVILASGPA